MTRLSYLFVAFLLFLSCTSNTILEPPKDLISKEKMISVYVDLHLAQSGSGVKNIHDRRNENYYQLVYDKYQIDTVQFKISNEYYASLIDEYHAMLMEVEKRLTNMQDKYQEAREVEDSIKKFERDKSRTLTPRESLRDRMRDKNRINQDVPLRKDSLIQ